jgi:bifunctional non-homologous end joining protein LigD
MSCGTCSEKTTASASAAIGAPTATGGVSLTLADYADQKRAAATKKGAVKIGADIAERWNNRVLARGLNKLGEPGATQYLADYGRGIAAPKVIALALKAEVEGCPDMARRFWTTAYALETGRQPAKDDAPRQAALGGRKAVPEDAPAPAVSPPTGAVPTLPAATTPRVEGLPDHLQPGKVSTMQPVDAPQDRAHYIASPDYWGQPKRDGMRTVATATEDSDGSPTRQSGSAELTVEALPKSDLAEVYYQSRSTNMRGVPSPEIQNTLHEAAQEFGSFVLDAELYYPDVNGGEHRTGAQAAKVNIKVGKGEIQPKPRLAIFKALYADERDLTASSEAERIEAGEDIGAWLVNKSPDSFEVLQTARTPKEKQALITRQQAEGREGEIWVRKDCQYRGGKDKGGKMTNPPIVRTKYLKEVDVVVMGLSKTTAAGRPFGAIEIGVYEGGKLKSLGSVGTGFDADEMAEIARQYEAGEPVVMSIGTQGYTEDGKVWHGRFIGLRDDKKAEECAL